MPSEEHTAPVSQLVWGWLILLGGLLWVVLLALRGGYLRVRRTLP